MDFNLIENVCERKLNIPKISIVITYLNRKQQILFTLDSIQKSQHNDYEVIIVDDGSDYNEYLTLAIYKYSFKIKLITINKRKKTWVNPVIAYNIGFLNACGDIIIIQNAEVCHIGDVISYIENNLKRNEYMVLSVYASPSFKHNEELYKMQVNNRNEIYLKFVSNIKYSEFDFDYKYYIQTYNELSTLSYKDALNHWLTVGINNNMHCNKSKIYMPNFYIKSNGWYNHPEYNNRCLHFISALHRENLNKIGGFDNKFSDGLFRDDFDFLERIKKICMVNCIPPSKVFAIHQYHESGSADIIRNENFNDLKKKNDIVFNFNRNQNIIFTDISNTFSDYNILSNDVMFLKTFKIGLFIKTYMDNVVDYHRLQIIKECLDSLKQCFENEYNKYENIHVIILVDGPTNVYHQELVDEYKDIFTIIKLEKNIGAAAVSNKGIEYLLSKNIDIGFGCDDDMIFMNGFIEHYLIAVARTGIHHFCFFPVTEIQSKLLYVKEINKIEYKCLSSVSGCFFTFTPDLIDKIGLFPIFPYKYGYWHILFTLKAAKYGFCHDFLNDTINSELVLKINKKSLIHKSCIPDDDLIEKNRQYFMQTRKEMSI